MHPILVVSDGTGGTAEQALRAALTQFPDGLVQIERRPAVRTATQACGVVEEAAARGALIVHTIVSTEVRNALHDAGRLHAVQTIDLMGPLLAQLAERLPGVPAEKPGLFRELNREYFERIEAMEFALRHDDGRRIDEVSGADIVLLGVSRTFKTPLSIYLALRGWLVANVPIILDRPLPEPVLQVPASKVFALTTDPQRLSLLRRTRAQHFGGATGDYADFEHVRQELRHAHRIFAARPEWTVVEVTHRPIEEIASEILSCLRSAQPPL